MVTITALHILDYAHYSTSDCTAINTEALTDIIIDYMNLKAGINANTFRAVGFPYTGLLSLTLTTSEYPVVMAGANLIIRAYIDRGPNVSISSMSVTTLINDPQYSFYSELFKTGIDRLGRKSIAFKVAEDTSGIEE